MKKTPGAWTVTVIEDPALIQELLTRIGAQTKLLAVIGPRVKGRKAYPVIAILPQRQPEPDGEDYANALALTFGSAISDVFLKQAIEPKPGDSSD